MGRYYNTDTGREGKFMFATQSSDDPEYLGMHEQERCSIDYYADEDDVEDITKKLDEQYDILGIAKKDRIYKHTCDKNDYKAYDEWESRVCKDKVWKTLTDDEVEAYKKEHQGKLDFWAGENNITMIEIEPGRCLALARIRLALDILSDIAETGSCSLEAEF